MDVNTIHRLIKKQDNKEPNFIQLLFYYFSAYKKTIKRILIYFGLFIILFKPALPARIVGNIVEKFVIEYTKIEKIYYDERKN